MFLFIILTVSLITVPFIVYKALSGIISVLFENNTSTSSGLKKQIKDKSPSRLEIPQYYIMIPDTSWLMEIGKKKYNPFLFLIEDFERKGKKIFFLIHSKVIKELDGLKDVKEKALQARRISRFIEETNNIYPGKIKINSLAIEKPYKKFKNGLQSETDAIVLTLASETKKKLSLKPFNVNVILLSTDRNQRILAQNSHIQICNPLAF